MSTRALAKIYDDSGEKVLVTIYKHWDGYPEGFGAELELICNGYTLVNGIGLDSKYVVANGMPCFAATLIKELKREAGDVYVYPPDTSGMWAEYIYHIKPDGEQIKVTCEEV